MNEKRISDRCQKLNVYVNSLSFYNFSIIFCLVFFILYAILINSYIRLFKIKEPHLWN